MAKQLSERAVEVLCVIFDRTDRLTGSFWLPGDLRGHSDPSATLGGECININGGGDAAILRSLHKRGLIERPPESTLQSDYVYRVTEDGILAIERERESGRLDAIAERLRKSNRRLMGHRDD